MLINGVWHDNITCPRCRFRHPATLHCAQADAIARAARPPTVPCEFCGKPTTMTGTQRCDGCWELAHRIRMDPELAKVMLDRLEDL